MPRTAPAWSTHAGRSAVLYFYFLDADCRNSRFLYQSRPKLFGPLIPVGAQHRRRTPRFTEVVLNASGVEREAGEQWPATGGQ